ncbi:MAG: hypothetical protein ACOC0C_01685 [Bacteroidota bacterium]
MINQLHYLNVLMLIFIFVSCEESENQPEASGFLNMKDATYTLDKGVLENWGTAEENDELDENYDGYLLGLTLVSPEVIIHQSNGRVDSISGEGQGIYFRIIDDFPEGFEKHVFTFDTEIAPGTLVYSAAMVNFDFMNDGLDDYILIEEGTLSINKTGTEYVIEFDGFITPEKEIEARYTGELVTFDVEL